MPDLTTTVLACPGCGGNLPAPADDGAVTCPFCGRLARPGAAAEGVREAAARREAEALLASLGRPPTLAQRVAVVLVNKWLWLLGGPFMVALFVRLGRVPTDLVAALWERRYQERLAHVAAPATAWLLAAGVPVLGLAATLLWSLLGERVSARRELQAALACRPPASPGGPRSCRQCGAPLEVPAGAPAVRCAHCDADNLVAHDAAWLAAARTVRARLHVTTQDARALAAQSRRRVLRAACWRVPLVLALLAVLGRGSLRLGDRAGWADFHLRPGGRVGLLLVPVRGADGTLRGELRDLPRCDDAAGRRALARGARLALADGGLCRDGACTAAAMVALARGDRLRLAWQGAPAAVDAALALAPRDYLSGGLGVLYDGFGEQVAVAPLRAAVAPAPAFEATAPMTGWYKLRLTGAAGDAAAAVEPCVLPAP